MERLREHIHRLDQIDLINLRRQPAQVPGQSSRVARDIDDFLRSQLQDALQRLGAAAGARWVEQYRVRAEGSISQLREQFLNLAGMERGIFNPVVQTIFSGSFGRGFFFFDTVDIAHRLRQVKGKEPDTAVKVKQSIVFPGSAAGAYNLYQRFGLPRVVLKEGCSWYSESGSASLFQVIVAAIKYDQIPVLTIRLAGAAMAAVICSRGSAFL